MTTPEFPLSLPRHELYEQAPDSIVQQVEQLMSVADVPRKFRVGEILQRGAGNFVDECIVTGLYPMPTGASLNRVPNSDPEAGGFIGGYFIDDNRDIFVASGTELNTDWKPSGQFLSSRQIKQSILSDENCPFPTVDTVESNPSGNFRRLFGLHNRWRNFQYQLVADKRAHGEDLNEFEKSMQASRRQGLIAEAALSAASPMAYYPEVIEQRFRSSSTYPDDVLALYRRLLAEVEYYSRSA